MNINFSMLQICKSLKQVNMKCLVSDKLWSPKWKSNCSNTFIFQIGIPGKLYISAQYNGEEVAVLCARYLSDPAMAIKSSKNDI